MQKTTLMYRAQLSNGLSIKVYPLENPNRAKKECYDYAVQVNIGADTLFLFFLDVHEELVKAIAELEKTPVEKVVNKAAFMIYNKTAYVPEGGTGITLANAIIRKLPPSIVILL
jgi:hypothetical protein